jgi:predicted PurR-regulated permease PerM
LQSNSRVTAESPTRAVSVPPAPVSRTDLATWIVAAIALWLVIQLHLLSGLLAGLLVYKLVDVLTPWLRLRAVSHERARVLAVTLIAAAVIAALVAISIGIVALLRNSGESLPDLMQKMAQIVEEARARLPAGLQVYIPDDAESL